MNQHARIAPMTNADKAHALWSSMSDKVSGLRDAVDDIGSDMTVLNKSYPDEQFLHQQIERVARDLELAAVALRTRL